MAELALAESAFTVADQAGAPEYAPIDLRLAREKMHAANQAMADNEIERARLLIIEAQVDAELAAAAAQKAKSRIKLWQAQDDIKTVRQQISENAQ